MICSRFSGQSGFSMVFLNFQKKSFRLEKNNCSLFPGQSGRRFILQAAAKLRQAPPQASYKLKVLRVEAKKPATASGLISCALRQA